MATIELVGGPLCGSQIRNVVPDGALQYRGHYSPNLTQTYEVVYQRRTIKGSDPGACRPFTSAAGHVMYDYIGQE